MPTYIGETNEDYTKGESYPIMRRAMTGRIYEPGRNALTGELVDRIGKPETRIMLWKDIYGPEAKMGYRLFEVTK